MMGKAKLIEIKQNARERAILVGVSGRGVKKSETIEYLEELALLADTAGADIIHTVIQDRNRIDPAYFIGKGKVEQLATLVADRNIDLIVFDDDLSAVQVRNLERDIGCKIVDRSGLILDIFASRAKTNEAKTQVGLAQLEYLLPRLTRQWTHLSKQYGGIGTKGPGEKQLETDRRVIRKHISHLRKKLEYIDKERETQRKGRSEFTRVALVGYTNAGKSTILNLLADANIFVEDRLFATLDATTRLVTLSPAKKTLLTDTVGFIRKLPHHLIASFKSTLAEVTEAEILLHVVDVSHSAFEEQIHVVNDTLEELQSHTKSTIMVFNKIDKLSDRDILGEIEKHYNNVVFISATKGINVSGLKEKIATLIEEGFVEHTLEMKQSASKVISLIHEIADIVEKKYHDDGVFIRFRIDRKNLEQLEKLLRQNGMLQSARLVKTQ